MVPNNNNNNDNNNNHHTVDRGDEGGGRGWFHRIPNGRFHCPLISKRCYC